MLDGSINPPIAICIAEKMTAIALIYKPEIGQVAESLKLVSVPVPRPLSNQVMIQVVASPMHIDEIYAAQGTALGRFFGPRDISTETPYVMGSGASGIVVSVGEGVTRFGVGDEVVVIPNELGETGSWATYRCASQDYVMHKPAVLSHVEAAATTLSACVAWGAINTAKVETGEHCLVVGASGAVGSMLVQFLKSKGAIVTGVCSGANESLVRKLGADNTIDYEVTDFHVLGKNAFDKVFDLVGGREIESAAYSVLRRSGRFVTVVGPVRHIGERKLSLTEFCMNIGHILLRSVTTRFFGPRYQFGATLPKRVAHAAMLSVAKHNIRTPIEKEVPLSLPRIQAAIKTLTAHRAKGRIVINFAQDERPI